MHSRVKWCQALARHREETLAGAACAFGGEEYGVCLGLYFGIEAGLKHRQSATPSKAVAGGSLSEADSTDVSSGLGLTQ